MGREVTSQSAAADAAILRQIDQSAITPFHLKVLFVSGMGFFSDAYDLFIIGVAIALLKPIWHLSTLEIALVTSTSLLASAIGAIVFGRIADSIGRCRIYGLEVLVLAAGAVASAFSPSIVWLIAFRFILGIGIGGDYPVSATIMSEYAGTRNRGLLVSLVFSMQAAGLIIGPLVAAGFLAAGLSHDLTWRIILALGAVPALSVFYLRRQIEETPRFLLQAKQRERLRGVAGNVLGNAAAPQEPSFITARDAVEEQGSALSGFRSLIGNRRLLGALIGAGGSWFLLDFAYYGNTLSGPLILKALDPHKSLLNDILLQLLIFAVAALPGYIVAVTMMDRIGRKTIQMVGFGIMAVAFALIGLVPGITSMVGPFLILYGISYFFTEFGPNTTTFVYPSEIFPVSTRTTGNGIAAAAGKTGAFIGVFAFPFLLSRFSLAGAELAAAAVSVLGLILTARFLPETKGRTLEELTEGLQHVA